MNTTKSLRTLSLAVLCLLASFPSALAAPWTPADLGDRLWLDWWVEDLANGSVSTWTSRNGAVNATQGTSANQPVKQNGEVFFGNNQKLTFPQQNRANTAHRAIMILFRIDLNGSGGGSIFAVNGVGGGYERQPYVGYDRSSNPKVVSVSWRTPGGYNGLSFTVPVNANQWHCLVSRRVGAVHYASIDGKQVDGVTPGESQVTMTDWAVPALNTSVTGYIGDFRTTTPAMAIDSVLVIQDEMSLEEAEKLMGWAMWRRGIQAQLPASHPYRNAAPVSTPPTYVFTESTPAEWTALTNFWTNTSLSEQYKGTPMDLTGWTLDFEDHFTSHTVTNDVTGEGAWFAPVHGAGTGSATSVVPTDANPQGTPATYIQSGSEMTIRMQNSGGWKSGVFCSVNLNGVGRTWMYPYFEVRMKTGPSSTGNTKGAWPALWVKSENEFFNLTESRLEYDFYEGYSSDNKGFHNSIHNWPAARILPSRLQTHRYNSNYLGLTTPGWYQNVNLFDNQYHTYGVMVTPTWVITMFDGRETFRFPTPIEMKQPLWMLADLALLPSEASQASGIYDMTIDYIRVYQNAAYDIPTPIVEYTFNETGTTAASSGSDSTAVTIYNASGVATDLHTADAGGVTGQPGDRALNFTSATGMGTGFTGPYAKHLSDNDAIDALKSFTVTGWFKTDGTTPYGNWARLIQNEPSGNGAGFIVTSDIPSGKIICNVDATNSAATPVSYGTAQQWVFYAVTYDGTLTTNNTKFYVGSSSTTASLVSTATLNMGTVNENTDLLFLGNRPGGDRPFDGSLDNIRIYGSKTDASGVLALADVENIRTADISNTLP
jgi:hypothetical protein